MRTNRSGRRVIAIVAASVALCVSATTAVGASTQQSGPVAKACQVTAVVGMSAQAARAELKRNGCSNIVTRMCATESMQFGLIIKQRPRASGPYPSRRLVTLWRVVKPATGVASCGLGDNPVETYDGLYTHTAEQAEQVCTTTYANGQPPMVLTSWISPFDVGSPAFIVLGGAFQPPVFEGTVGADGRVQVSPQFNFSYFPNPTGWVSFAQVGGRMVATGTLSADNVTVEASATSRMACSVRYSFTAERTDS